MNAHFLLPYATQAWPVVDLIRARWHDATFDCGAMAGLTYRSRLEYALRLPRLLWFGLRSGMRALARPRPPAAFFAGSDLEVIGLSLARLLRRKRVPIVLGGFIFTQRKAKVLNVVRTLHFRAVLSRTDLVICHSTLEPRRCAAFFQLRATRFVTVPFGLHVNVPRSLQVGSQGYMVSAGRSGRDYALLTEVFSTLSFELRIVCDATASLESVHSAPNISILRDCYGDEYLQQLAGADLVILPIKADDVSAGQMVLLQAMALGKPVVITRTPTTEEYGEHLKTLFFVERGSEDDLRAAIERLASDPQLRKRIGDAAKAHFEATHSLAAFANGVLDAMERASGAPLQGKRTGA